MCWLFKEMPNVLWEHDFLFFTLISVCPYTYSYMLDLNLAARLNACQAYATVKRMLLVQLIPLPNPNRST